MGKIVLTNFFLKSCLDYSSGARGCSSLPTPMEPPKAPPPSTPPNNFQPWWWRGRRKGGARRRKGEKRERRGKWAPLNLDSRFATAWLYKWVHKKTQVRMRHIHANSNIYVLWRKEIRDLFTASDYFLRSLCLFVADTFPNSHVQYEAIKLDSSFSPLAYQPVQLYMQVISSYIYLVNTPSVLNYNLFYPYPK